VQGFAIGGTGLIIEPIRWALLHILQLLSTIQSSQCPDTLRFSFYVKCLSLEEFCYKKSQEQEWWSRSS